MTLVSCPICAGPVELTGARPSCLIGHDFDSENLSSELDREAARALWSAVRALEDSAASARWRMSQSEPPVNGELIIRRAEREAQLLRELIAAREGGSSDSEHRPRAW